MNSEKKKALVPFVVLHALMIFYSLSGVLSKIAAKQEFLSWPFILLYGGMIFILGVYALVWQQILKHISLTTAFCNKSVTIIWGILFGALFFHETIQWTMIVGAAIVIVGVVLVVKADES